MIAEFIKPQDQRWTAFLKNCRHDFYHLPGYVELAARHEGGTPVAFYAEDGYTRLLAPLLIRKVPANLGISGDWYDAVTPYGYPTPILTPPDDSSSLAHFLKAFKKIGIERGIITAFFRLHPLMPLPKEVLDKYGMLVKHGQTVYVDLSLSPEEIWYRTSGWHRSDIQKLTRLGFQTKMDDWSLFGDFLTVYNMTMRRVSASKFYLFSSEYFEGLRSVLDDRLHLCTVLSPEEEIASAELFTVVNGMVQGHLAGTSNKYLHRAPSKLASNAICHWAKGTGNHLFHLGGGVGGRSDSLFEFKAGFSRLRADFYTYRMILDEGKYAILTHLWRKQQGQVEAGDTDFFPAYRNCA